MSAIPEYAFLTTQQTPTVDLGQENVLVGQHPKLRQENVEVSQNPKTSTEIDIPDVVVIPMDANINSKPSISQDMSRPTAQPTQRAIDDSRTLTPSKILAMLSPIPNVKKNDSSQGTSSSVAKILSSPESIQSIATMKQIKNSYSKKNMKGLKGRWLVPKLKRIGLRLK